MRRLDVVIRIERTWQKGLIPEARTRGTAMISALLLSALFVGNIPTIDASTPGARSAERPKPPKGVIVIVTDDQGYGDFGFHGNPVIRTPHLDTLAKGSARLPTFYVNPVCAPTRASLMTGRFAYRTRVLDTYIGRAMMEPDEVTIAETLRDAGFATGIFGKWHLGDSYPLRPQDQGFDEVLVHRGGGIGQPSDPIGAEGRYTDPVLMHNGEEELQYGYCTRVYFDSARKWIREQASNDKPFFAYIPTNAPHGPFHDVPAGWLASNRERDLSPGAFPDEGYPLPKKHNESRLGDIFAMIEDIDENVGRLIKDLRQQELLDDTLILFMVDNGPNSRRYVGGFRGMKSDVFEGGIRSPFFAHWPAAFTPGDTVDRIGAHIDVMPTILDACGVKPRSQAAMDGRSLMPLLTREAIDEDWSERPMFIQVHRGDEPLRYHHFMARQGPWKLVHPTGFREAKKIDLAFQLYNLAEDPFEQNDLAAQHPDRVEHLRALYDAWLDDVSSTRPDNYAPPRIHLGTDAEPTTVLTRQDWRRDSDDGGWSPRSLGHWEVEVTRSGRYRIEIVPRKKPAADRFVLRIGDSHWRGLVRPGERVVVENVRLPAGPASLEVELWDDSGVFGAHQVFVSRD